MKRHEFPCFDVVNAGWAGSLADVHQQFQAFYFDQHPKLMRFMRLARGTDLPAIEDAIQGAFLIAWQRMNEGLWDQMETPQAWIRIVALHEYDHPTGMRRIQPKTSQLPEELLAIVLPPDPPPTEMSILVTDLMKALKALNDQMVRAVMAFTLDGFTDSEIASGLDLDAQRIRNLRKKARDFLKIQLAAHRVQEGDRSDER